MRRRLSQSQAGEVWRAASVLPPAQRDAFLRAVDGRLVGIRRHQLTDDDVNAAIVTVLADASITTTSHFMCDSASHGGSDGDAQRYEVRHSHRPRDR